MKKSVKRRSVNQKFWPYFAWLVLIDVIFTGFDAIGHSTIELLEIYYYPIPSVLTFISTNPLFWYGVGKFAATLIFGSILFIFLKRCKSVLSRALVLTIPVILLMEGRYVVSGAYGAEWHVANTIMHGIILFVASYVVFSRTRLFK